MSHHNAPATRLLATHCPKCGTALSDALSVEIGVGPKCRRDMGWSKKTGFKPDAAADWFSALILVVGVLDETVVKAVEKQDAHALCNKLVYLVACDPLGAQVPAMIKAIEAVGYRKLAGLLAEGVKARAEDVPTVLVTVEGGVLVVVAPYSEAFTAEARKVRGSRWVPERKVRTFPVTEKRELWRAIKASYAPGTRVVGERTTVL